MLSVHLAGVIVFQYNSGYVDPVIAQRCHQGHIVVTRKHKQVVIEMCHIVLFQLDV